MGKDTEVESDADGTSDQLQQIEHHQASSYVQRYTKEPAVALGLKIERAQNAGESI